MKKNVARTTIDFLVTLFLFGCFYCLTPLITEAASLSISPSTGVYTSNSTFTVKVNVNSSGKPINAAEGTITFNKSELSVVSVNRSGSIFNLWVTEPTFSNSAGTITWSGGLPSGYTGSAGNILTITFKAVGSGTAKANFGAGSVLANDGKGTNVLTSMNGGTYTIQAASAAPVAEEVVIEYVAPANTPKAPSVKSETHPEPNAWYNKKEVILSWELPSGVTSVRTLLDDKATTVPTKVYDSPISTITLSDLPEGISYFHVQFRNADGWGQITHYRLAVDTQKPTAINITPSDESDDNNPVQKLRVEVDDATSQVRKFMVKVNDGEPFEFTKENASSTIELPSLVPGYYTAIIEGFDEAGNSIIGSYAFSIAAFEAPLFTEYPSEINEQVIPVIKGTTRPNASVEVTIRKSGTEPTTYTVASNAEGIFTFIPDGRFSTGVYELTARAIDQYGAQSDLSSPIKIAVQAPGFIRVGTFLVSVLSVLIPLVLLTLATIMGSWYLIAYLRRFRKSVNRESTEALNILHQEFTTLQKILRTQEALMVESKKTKKLSRAESDMIKTIDLALQNSQRKVEKEIQDVTNLTDTHA